MQMNSDLELQEQWILENADAISQMVQTPGWKLFKAKVVEDITNQMNTVFQPNADVDLTVLQYAKGYVTALKNMVAFAEGCNEAARQIEKQLDDRVERRKQILEATK